MNQAYRLSPPRIALALVLWAAVPAQAQLRDSFETAFNAWKLAGADCGVKLLAQEHSFRESHSGQSSEFLKLQAGAGSFIHLSYAVGQAPVIAELAPSLWVKADRPNLQLLARVILPRTLDRASGKPIAVFLPGEAYSDVGRWQQLRVREPLKALEFQRIVKSRELRQELDIRGAFMDLVVLNAYSGPGEVQIWLDDLEVGGIVDLGNGAPGAEGALRPNLPATPEAANSPLPEVQGTVLLARGRPFSPRALQYQGEPLEWLQSLGINAIKLSSSPSPELLREAQRVGIWIIAPPPFVGDALPAESYGGVLAWSLGARLVDHDLAAARDLASEVRQLDPKLARPLLSGADAELGEFSRLAPLLCVDQRALGGSFELADLRSWILDRRTLARPGTIVWTTLQTQQSPVWREQIRLLAGAPPGATAAGGPGRLIANGGDLREAEAREGLDELEPDQLRLAAYHALAAGSRGLIFASNEPLAIDSVNASLRTDSIKYLNLELKLLEPWLSGGQLSDELGSADGAIEAAVWQTERSRLLLVSQRASSQQHAVGPSPRTSCSLVVPGVPSSHQAYEVSLAGWKPLRSTFASGGLRIPLEELGPATAVVVTQDPLVIHHLRRTLNEVQSEASRLRFDLTSRRLTRTTEIDQQLTLLGKPLGGAVAAIAEAQANLEQARRMLETSDAAGVHKFVGKAELSLARVRRGHWEQTARAFPSPAASPCVSQFASLPAHWRTADRMRSGAWGPDQLGGGDMESLDQLTQLGWRQQRRLPPGVAADVSISLQNPHSGRSALRLQAIAADRSKDGNPVERPLLWITSAPVRVRLGQIARIHAWVNVPERLQGTHDGLLVFDSLGGLDLAERVHQTRGWREVTLYRAVPETRDLTITFSLTGRGEAWIDEVSVTLLEAEPVRER